VRPETQGHLAMLAFSALVAGSFSLGVLAANLVDPAALMAVRFGLAAVVIGVVAWASGKLSWQAFRAPWRYVLTGGLFAAYFVLMFEGLKTAPPISAAAVFTLTPIISAIAGWLLLRQVTTLRIALALAIGACGALWVIFRADWQLFRAFHVGVGEVTYFIGCIAHAFYTPLLRKLNRGESAVVFSFGVLVAGFVLLMLYAGAEVIATDWAAMPPIVWITLAYLVVFSTAMSFVLLQTGSMRLPSAKVMAYTYLTPTWVIVWEMALGHGVPTGMMLVGVALTVVALVMLLEQGSDSTTKRPRTEP